MAARKRIEFQMPGRSETLEFSGSTTKEIAAHPSSSLTMEGQGHSELDQGGREFEFDRGEDGVTDRASGPVLEGEVTFEALVNDHLPFGGRSCQGGNFAARKLGVQIDRDPESGHLVHEAAILADYFCDRRVSVVGEDVAANFGKKQHHLIFKGSEF